MTTETPLYLRAFPEFASSEMPPIPADWRDVSWRNDVCPSFVVAGNEMRPPYVRVWIDHSDVAQREMTQEGRFTVERVIDGEGDFVDVVTTDKWWRVLETVETERLAFRFAELLARDLTADEWQTMRDRNSRAPDGVCASHDWIDANETMADAFADVMGRPIFTGDEIAAADQERWNAAWNVATPAYLTTQPGSVEAMFDVWRTTGRDVERLADHADLIGTYEGDEGGRIYETGFVERAAAGAGYTWHVVCSNSSDTFDELMQAERFLWEGHARGVIMHDYHCAAPMTKAAAAGWVDKFAMLASEWSEWLALNGLPQEAAEETAARDDLTDEQRAFVVAFRARWDALEDAKAAADVADQKAGAAAFPFVSYTPRPNRFRIALEAARAALAREGSHSAAAAVQAILDQSGCEHIDPLAFALTDAISIIIDG